MQSQLNSNNLYSRSSRQQATRSHGPMWGVMIAGMLLGLVGMHTLVTRPMIAEITALGHRVETLHRDLEVLSGMRDQWTMATDVVAGLAEQRVQIEEAWNALDSMNQINESLVAESYRVGASIRAIESIRSLQNQLASLKEDAIRQSAGVVIAKRSLAESSALQADFARQIGDTRGLRRQVVELGELAEDIARHQGAADQARKAFGTLVTIKNDIIQSSHDIEFSRRRVDSLIEIATRLRSDSGQTAAAVENLNRHEALSRRLSASNQPVIDAIETLDLLERFQREFGVRAREIEANRKALADVSAITASTERLLMAMKPVARLHDLRLTSDADLRAAARAILDRSQVGSILDRSQVGSILDRSQEGLIQDRSAKESILEPAGGILPPEKP